MVSRTSSTGAARRDSSRCSTTGRSRSPTIAGNRQYITAGNLADNPQAFIFLMDYATRTRIKLWGTARAVENDPSLLARLAPAGGKPRVERAIVFEVVAWDANCPQHIPLKHDEEEVAALRARIGELEQENAGLRREREAS